jgi:hypothetical protein
MELIIPVDRAFLSDGPEKGHFFLDLVFHSGDPEKGPFLFLTPVCLDWGFISSSHPMALMLVYSHKLHCTFTT